MDNDDGNGKLPPIPKAELDAMIARAEQMAAEQESPVHGSIGVVPDEDGDGRDEGGNFAHVRPRVATARARQNPAPIPVSHKRPQSFIGKPLCPTCGLIGTHAPGCPGVQPKQEVVNVAELAKQERQNEPSIRRQLKRIAVGFLKRVADKLEG